MNHSRLIYVLLLIPTVKGLVCYEQSTGFARWGQENLCLYAEEQNMSAISEALL